MKINPRREEEEEDGQEEVQGENSTALLMELGTIITAKKRTKEEWEGGIQNINNDENNDVMNIGDVSYMSCAVYGVVNVPSCSTNPNLV